VATLRLVDEGRLRLDDRVADLLPRDLVGPIPNIQEITVGLLLDHSSGIYGFNNNREYLNTLVGSEAGKGITWSSERLVALAYEGVNDPFGVPGQGQFYGDTNYVLLGQIVEAITGESFRDYIRKNLLEPLGMSRTRFFSEFSPFEGYFPENAAQGYTVLSEELLAVLEPSSLFPRLEGGLANTTPAGETLDAAAGLVGPIDDLGRFARALYARDLLTSEGDGPGGVNTVMAWHPASGTIVVGFTNIFGLWGETEFILDEIFSQVVIAE
jgi:CubicO group peptidase (beta-lactamase class C family)